MDAAFIRALRPAERAQLRAWETVYVGGAGGNVGNAATAMARRAGARGVATARPEDHNRCRAAGVDVVLSTKDVNVLGFIISRAQVSDLAEAVRFLNGEVPQRHAQSGSLSARVSEVLPLSAMAGVHARLEAGQVVGRILLRP